jgi:hypothetical protein
MIWIVFVGKLGTIFALFVSIMTSQVTNSLGVLGILLLESYVTDDIIGVCAQCRTGRE